ncbi:30S ribosomal protein S2 [Candidatus Kaiserbacteria bacterium RIFCSPHIGHO2_01_FULL_46_22]|uniref:Small ribosomal subunit protein uS2 n=1 Tax=Candidatus Kaiserbacteria bacterium RIFCSPHIGHO2_01_FULL_46_22 TaxID=1798475 RepID=A0A1F6BY47_9BACT|nr:MAG: 30S ribosomal protein S2 [Candidatus Kaiserbacteria bacterium RIFCSPHIGHO2_01_FULL_46_22]
MSNQNLIDRMFAAGAHFGFKKSRRHPSMKPYLFGSKEGTDIFDLEHSVALLESAKEALKTAGMEGKTVLFVGTKEEVSKQVREQAEKISTPYVTNRWVGGMLTNWSEVKKRLGRLSDLVSQGESGELERKYTKKERVVITRELNKLMHNFGGIRTLERLPDMLVIIDPRHDKLAVAEAREKNIPIVAVMSSDNDAKSADYPVVQNDTLRASVDIALTELAQAYAEGKAAFVPKPTSLNNRRRITR